MTRFVSLALFALSIGACVVSRKGADAGGGPGTTGGTTGGPGPVGSTTGGNPPSGPAAPTGTTAVVPAGQGAPQGQPCEDGNCAPGLTCVSYYGFAGPAGPKFTSCEIKCQTSGKPGCPAGQSCITIADGPGTVCRPSDR